MDDGLGLALTLAEDLEVLDAGDDVQHHVRGRCDVSLGDSAQLVGVMTGEVLPVTTPALEKTSDIEQGCGKWFSCSRDLSNGSNIFDKDRL